jgi:hypothetical protein
MCRDPGNVTPISTTLGDTMLMSTGPEDATTATTVDDKAEVGKWEQRGCDEYEGR